MPVKQVGFNPKRSQVAPDALAEFIRAPLGSLSNVPDLGPAGIKELAKAKNGSVTNTHQLMGKFLALRPDNADIVEHLDRFWYWLESKGIQSGRRSGIAQCIAEKADMAYPGVYNPGLWS